MPAPLVLTMQTAPFSDSITIQLDSSNHNFLQVHDNFFSTNTAFDRATFDSIDVIGTAGKAGLYFLTLDFTHGNFLNTLTAGGLDFNMGTNANFEVNNTLNIVGDASFDTELQTPDPSTRCNGTIVFDANQAINYFGVPHVNDSVEITGTATYQGYLASSLASENINIVNRFLPGGVTATEMTSSSSPASARGK